MIYSGGFAALLHANVLYPAPVRDYLLHLAAVDLYKPKWTIQIQNEWINNLLVHRRDLRMDQLVRTREAMDSAFPDANITGYKELVSGLSLPDKNDNHILAAANRSKVDVIVTFNLKDFPAEYLRIYDLEAQHPDTFVQNLISLDQSNTIRALDNQIKSLKNPPRTKKEVIETLTHCGLGKRLNLLRG